MYVAVLVYKSFEKDAKQVPNLRVEKKWINLMGIICTSQIWLNTYHFVVKRSTVQEMIKWCTDVESGSISKLLIPEKNWFLKSLRTLMTLFKISVAITLIELMLLFPVFVFLHRLAVGSWKLNSMYSDFVRLIILSYSGLSSRLF